MSDPWLIIGLGNPEPRYARNRHNVGHMVIDVLAGRAGARLTGHKTRARLAEARLGVMPGGAPGPRVILAEPASYMNLSGGPRDVRGRVLSWVRCSIPRGTPTCREVSCD